MASRGPGVRSHTGVPRVDFFYFFTIVLHLFTCLLAVPGLPCCSHAAVSRYGARASRCGVWAPGACARWPVGGSAAPAILPDRGPSSRPWHWTASEIPGVF